MNRQITDAERTGLDTLQRPIQIDQPERALTVPDQSASLMEVISRAAFDPNTDVNKLERLMAMYERITGQRSEQEFNAAMTAAQGDMHPVAADATNPQTKSQYASYAALDRAMRPIYTKHGFALSFGEGDTPKPDHLRVTCLVTHSSGHSRLYFRDMPADGKGAKGGDVMTKTHASGAAQSYGMRYLVKGIFNIAVGDDDDDGNGAADAFAPIDESQLGHIQDLIQRSGADVELFCKYMGVEALKLIKQRDYPKAITALNLKDRKASKK